MQIWLFGVGTTKLPLQNYPCPYKLPLSYRGRGWDCCREHTPQPWSCFQLPELPPHPSMLRGKGKAEAERMQQSGAEACQDFGAWRDVRAQGQPWNAKIQGWGGSKPSALPSRSMGMCWRTPALLCDSSRDDGPEHHHIHRDIPQPLQRPWHGAIPSQGRWHTLVGGIMDRGAGANKEGNRGDTTANPHRIEHRQPHITAAPVPPQGREGSQIPAEIVAKFPSIFHWPRTASEWNSKHSRAVQPQAAWS